MGVCHQSSAVLVVAMHADAVGNSTFKIHYFWIKRGEDLVNNTHTNLITPSDELDSPPQTTQGSVKESRDKSHVDPAWTSQENKT